MDIALQITLLIIGFILLIKGADFMVDGASSVASHFKISKLLIGLTIVAFGTSAPELAVSFSSLANGSTDMLLGNVIGSNILNILLLIGVGAIIHPLKITRATVIKELPLLLLISSALVVVFLDINLTSADANIFSRSDAIICLLFFAIFLYYIIATARKNRADANKVEKPKFKLPIAALFTILGLAGIVIGAQLVVNSATTIATGFGISERIISLTVIAFGTSLPELVTTIVAAKKGATDLVVGNIIGSNIFNICIVLALPVSLFGAITPGSFEMLDLVLLIGSAAILFLTARSGHKITRLEGALMLVIFAIYYSYIIFSATL